MGIENVVDMDEDMQQKFAYEELPDKRKALTICVFNKN